MAIRAHYIGPDFLNGVPAQDMDDETYQAFDAGTRKAIRECGAWEVLTDREYADAVREGKRADPTVAAKAQAKKPKPPKTREESPPPPVVAEETAVPEEATEPDEAEPTTAEDAPEVMDDGSNPPESDQG